MNLAELILSTQRRTQKAREYYFDGKVEMVVSQLKSLARKILGELPDAEVTDQEADGESRQPQ